MAFAIFKFLDSLSNIIALSEVIRTLILLLYCTVGSFFQNNGRSFAICCILLIWTPGFIMYGYWSSAFLFFLNGVRSWLEFYCWLIHCFSNFANSVPDLLLFLVPLHSGLLSYLSQAKQCMEWHGTATYDQETSNLLVRRWIWSLCAQYSMEQVGFLAVRKNQTPTGMCERFVSFVFVSFVQQRPRVTRLLSLWCEPVMWACDYVFILSSFCRALFY